MAIMPNCKRQETSIPQSLGQIIPSCAQACLNDYLNIFWVPQLCKDESDLACLCDNYSTSGYSLGEIALACASSACENVTDQQSQQLYGVCNNQSNAVSATHTILTVLVSATPSPNIPPSSSQPRLTTTSSAKSSLTSSVSTTLQTESSQAPPPTAVATTAASLSTASPITAANGGQLTTGQAVGVTVAAFSGVGLVAALLFLCCCFRRRKRKRREEEEANKKHSYDFACAHTPPAAHFRAFSQPHVPPPAVLSHGRSRSLENTSMHPAHRSEDVPAVEAAASSVSPQSTKSTTRLLHSANVPQTPTRSRAGRPFSYDTVFEEDTQPWSPGLQRPAPTQRPVHSPQYQVPPSGGTPGGRPLPSVSRILRAPSDRSTRSINKRKLSVTIPEDRNTYIEPGTPMFTASGHQSLQHDRARFQQASQPLSPSQQANSAGSYIPAYYTSKDSRTPKGPMRTPDQQQATQVHWQNPPPAGPLPKPPRGSRASETSFESIDSQEVTPPEIESRPLDQASASPISGLRYPKIPRSANEVIPRWPPASPAALALPAKAAEGRGNLAQAARMATPNQVYMAPSRSDVDAWRHESAYPPTPPNSLHKFVNDRAGLPSQRTNLSPPRAEQPRLTLWPTTSTERR